MNTYEHMLNKILERENKMNRILGRERIEFGEFYEKLLRKIALAELMKA